MSGATSILDSLAPVSPPPGVLAAQGAPQYMSPQEMASGSATVRPGGAAAKPDQAGTSTKANAVLDSLPPVAPTSAMLMAQGKSPTGAPETTWGGLAQNFAAGANRSIFGALGTPVDLATGAINAGLRGVTGVARAINPILGGAPPPDEAPQITNPVGGSQWLGQQFGRVGTDPNAVQPQTEAERVAQGAGGAVAQIPLLAMGGAGLQGAGGIPGMVGNALRAGGGASGPEAARVAVAAGAGGGAGQAAEDAAPAPLKPYAAMAGNVAGAGATLAAEQGARLIARPAINAAQTAGIGAKSAVGGIQSTPAQQRAAGLQVSQALGPEGGQIVERATGAEAEARDLEQTLADPETSPNDRQAAQQRLQQIQGLRVNLVPGSEPTTAQLAPTPGAVALDKAHRVASPEPFLQRAQDQNTARVGAIQAVQPEGQPGTVGQLFRQQLATIDDAGQTATGAARQGVQQATEGLGGAGTQEAAGEGMREALATRNQAARGRERALWEAVDPDGTLALPLGAVQQTARELIKEMSPGLGDAASGQEMQILHGAAGLPDVIPFRDAQRLRSNIGFAERALRAAPGNDQSLRRLGLLKSSLDDAIAQGADAAAAQDSGVAGRLDALRRDENGQGLSGGPGGTGDEVRPGAGASGVPGAGAGQGGAGGRQGDAPGHSGVAAAQTTELPADLSPFEQELYAGLAPKPKETLQPHFTPEAAQTYTQARGATVARKQTFGQGPVGATLRPGQQGAEFRLENAQVPRQFLTGNAVEPSRVQKYIEAVGGEAQAVGHMRDALIGDLRDKGIVQADGTIKPDAYAAWVARRGRTIDLFPGLRDQLANAGAAQKTLDDATAAHLGAVKDYQNGVARDFLRDEPLVAVRKAFASGNPTQTFEQLTRAVQGNPDAEAGLRRGVVDFILERHSSTAPAGTDNIDFLKAATFRQWIRQNRGPLRVLFGGQGMQSLDMVSADMRRAAQRATATAGSDTEANRISTAKLGLGVKHAVGAGAYSLMTLLGERLGEMAGEHGLAGAIAAPAIGFAAHALRQAGIKTVNDLVREAMLHPELARVLMQKAEGPQLGPLAQRRIGIALQGAIAADTASPHQKDSE